MKAFFLPILSAGFLATARSQSISVYGACFIGNADCEALTDPRQDSTLVDCLCSGGQSFGIVQDGVRACIGLERESGGYCLADMGICPDGTSVPRSQPHCQFVCPDGSIGCRDGRRLCPDGSTVGVTFPSCEYEECPPLGNRKLQANIKWFGDRLAVLLFEPKIFTSPIDRVSRVFWEYCGRDPLVEVAILEYTDPYRDIRVPVIRIHWDAPPKTPEIECVDLGCCSGECVGEPHIKQLRGGWFDYQGECDLVLLHAPAFGGGLGLDIHVRTKIRYAYSYILSASIRIGDDILEVAGFGNYILNGVATPDLSTTEARMAGYPMFHKEINDKQHMFAIEIDGGNHIQVGTNKDIVSVEIVPATGIYGPEMYQWFGNSTGLMGSLSSSKMIARDGVTEIEDPNEFGQEWQVRYSDPGLFFEGDRAPQYPAKCILPNPNAAEKSRRLGNGVEREAAEKACDHWMSTEKDHCIFDVMATGDLELAGAGGY